MNKVSKFTLSALMSLSIFACNTQIPSIDSNKDVQVSSLNQNLGQVSVNVNTLFPKKFGIKAFDLSKTTKLKLEIKGNDITTPIMSSVVNYVPGQSSTLSVSVKPGKNRIVSLYLMDDYNNITGTLMGVVDVTSGTNSAATVSYFETAIAQIILGILNSSNPNLLSTLDINAIRTYVTNITGYDKTNNSFSKINPSQLHTVAIANTIVTNNGPVNLPPESTPGLIATKDLTLALNTSGVKVMINDLNSTAITNTSSNTTQLNGIGYGRWKLTLMKDGYKSQSMDINISDNTPSSLTLTLDNYFANYVSIGDSLTAGYQSGAVQKDKQLNDYPLLIAKAGNVTQTDFKQPYIAEPSTGYGFGGADSQGFYGELKPDGSRFRLSLTSQAQLPTLLEAVNEPLPYNNLGIPGAKLEEIVSTKLSDSNPFFSFVLRNRGLATDASELDQAIFKKPSVITLWAGNNDVLGAATGGNSTGVTPLAQFQASYTTLVNKLINQTTADVFVATIPDVTNIPYTSTMVRKSFLNNDINTPVVDVPTGNPNLPVVERAIPTEETNVKYILINALGVIPTLTAGQKLAANYTLTETEVSQLKDTVVAYNDFIKAQISTNPRLTLVDTNKLLGDVNSGLVTGASGKVFLLDPVNTMFSYDSVHPNSKGYKLVANEFVRVINQKYGFNLLVP